MAAERACNRMGCIMYMVSYDTSLRLPLSSHIPLLRRCKRLPTSLAANAAIQATKMGVGITILHKLVRNDAMKIDPPEIYNLRVFLLACASCFGGTLFGMDIGIIGGVITLPSFQK